jgi:hypothetical protein
MLFLAVTLGFFVENQREHWMEHKKEKEYIRSMIRDVSTDIEHIDQWTKQYTLLLRNCDTVLDQFSTSSSASSTWSRNMFSILHGFPDFISTDETMQQLKNAGGLRLIRNPDARDSIAAYDAAIRDILIEETVNEIYYGKITEIMFDQISYRKMTEARQQTDTIPRQAIFWIHYDDTEMEKLYNQVFQYRIEIGDFIKYMGWLAEQGKRLIVSLKKEYHLK